MTEGEEYVAAIRDWVTNGERSTYALSDEAFAARVKRRSDKEMEADASFALAVHFYQANNMASAKKYFEHAQALNPDDWNYHRQDWSFTPGEAGAKWLEKFQKLDEPYYPKLDLKRRPRSRRADVRRPARGARLPVTATSPGGTRASANRPPSSSW